MKLDRRHFLGATIATTGSLIAAASLSLPREMAIPLKPQPETQLAGGPPLLQKALAALDRHSAHFIHRDRVGLVDFAKHSGATRFHLADVEGGHILRSLLVSHGRGSDPDNSGYATLFSNRPGSHASSSGSYLTGDAYVGKHGRSRRLHGLDDENDQAFERAIVIHGADYVDRTMAEQQGRVGRSLGCFAFERSEIAGVLELLGPGRLLLAAG